MSPSKRSMGSSGNSDCSEDLLHHCASAAPRDAPRKHPRASHGTERQRLASLQNPNSSIFRFAALAGKSAASGSLPVQSTAGMVGPGPDMKGGKGHVRLRHWEFSRKENVPRYPSPTIGYPTPFSQPHSLYVWYRYHW